LKQSGRQVAARGPYPLRWYFAEQEAADFARKLFQDAGGGRDTIDIQVVPWSESLK